MNRIKELRGAVPAEPLAAASGISAAEWYRLEHGQRLGRPSTRHAVVRALRAVTGHDWITYTVVFPPEIEAAALEERSNVA
jgi:hypothetical protein